MTDASGAPVPEAQVTATNTETNVSKGVPTEVNGTYQFLQLPVGTYTIKVTKAGFQTFVANGVLLVLNQVYTLPVSLEVGQVSESVQVQADTAQVETSTTQLGTVIESQKIVNLPLNGRDWVQLQQLVPGVVSQSDRFSDSYATNGSQSQQNSFLINGVDSNENSLNTPLIIPSPDAIEEFNLIDSTINPEYGRNSGGVLNAIIKRGSNAFHGSAFEFYRDTFLNGRNLFKQSSPVFHQNQFGGTLGGPVWKDHTFFFLSYQGTRNRAPQTGVSSQSTVFTQDQRNGFFPALASSTTASPVPLVGENGLSFAAGTPYSTIFPTGRIPNADFNPISQKLLGLVPLPNSPGGLYAFNPITTHTDDQGIARVDHTIGTSDALWGSILIENLPVSSTLPFLGATVPGFGELDTETYKTFSADWTHTFSPNTLNELRASYTRFNYLATYPANPALPSTLGFTGITPQDASGAAAPRVSLTGYFDLGFSPYGPQPRLDNTYELSDSLSKVAGNHTLKFGFDGKRYGVNNPYFSSNNGNYTFGGNGLYTTGDPGADFLLGIPDQYQQGSGGWVDARSYEYYMYAQDNWKVNQNLTLNYGVGYQIDTPMVNQHFGSEAFDCFRPGQQSTVFPSAPVGLVFPGDTGCSSSGYYTHYGHVGPRFGFAYSPGSGSDKKFVIRGGFGVYFNKVEEELLTQNVGAVPFALTSAGAGGTAGLSPAFANPFADIATGQTVANPFPFTPPTKGASVDFSQYFPMSLNTINPNLTAPYAMNYNLNIQRELPGAMVLQVGYVAALGRHLEMAYEGNPISLAGQAACAADPGCIANRVNQHVSYPSHAQYAPGDVFASVGTQATVGVSTYNSLQVSLNKRLTHGLSFLAGYTWSHSIDDTSGFENSSFNSRGTNPYNFASNKGDSAFDARHRFVVSYDYEIPHLSRIWSNGFVRGAFDGWHIAGITTLQSGFPIPIADGGFRSLTCDSLTFYACPDTPNLVSTPTSLNPRNSSEINLTKNPANTTAKPYYWFNPNSFSREALGTFGNAGRNNFHGPGINNTDLNLSKRIYLGKSEIRFLELRLEGYNVFNHTQFAQTAQSNGGNGVNGDINSANFGRVLTAIAGRTIQLGAKIYF